MAGEMVQFPSGVIGVAFNLEENSVGVIILGDYLEIEEGHEVKALGKLSPFPAATP
jgi:F-type H+-transporting ATPase subunit alpha